MCCVGAGFVHERAGPWEFGVRGKPVVADVAPVRVGRIGHTHHLEVMPTLAVIQTENRPAAPFGAGPAYMT